MITPKEIREKCDKAFYKVVSSELKGQSLFPWTIPSNKQIAGTNYNEWKADLLPLHEHSKDVKGFGYTVDWRIKSIDGSKQSVPSKIYFETFEDYLQFCKKVSDYKKIEKARHLLLYRFPIIEFWVNNNPSVLLESAEQWEDLIKVCSFFVSHPPPHPYYIRELPIEVHSKFIEQNSGLLRKLLDILLPSDWVNSAETEFASRYFLKKVNVYTQIRILDDELQPFLGYDECSLSLDDAAWLKWTPEKVFIIENQICFITFPKVKNSVAIFGEGFKSRVSKHIPWLEKTQLYCWFDLDAAGFEMLNMIRQFYPDALSFLMDRETYSRHSNFTVENNSRRKKLPYLLSEENELYELLVNNNKRLEQEKISQVYVLNKLNER